MKKIIALTLLSTFLVFPSCRKECEHLYTKWSMDAERHWIACDLCGHIEIEQAPHDWIIISAENVDGTGVVSSLCKMCGQTSVENTQIDREVTNEEWDSALSVESFKNVTAEFRQKDGGELYHAIYYIDGSQVKEELWENGELSDSQTVEASQSQGKNHLITTLKQYIDTFGGFDFIEADGIYHYQRIIFDQCQPF